MRSKVSSQRGERQPRIRSRFDEERMSLDIASKPNSAGPRLHRCNGRALTPQGAGPAKSEREQDDEYSQQYSIT